MTIKKLLIIFFLTSICVAGFIYVKQRFYDPRQKLVKAKEKVNLLKGKEIQDGDLIFQSSMSSQSKAIQLATHSKYSHCGIIFKEGKDYIVFEAIQPVKKTPLDKWIGRGNDGHYVIKRLKNSEKVLTPVVTNKMKEVSKGFEGKNYDLYFEWTDNKIYCSELIWKIYQRATGVEIGKLERLKSFDLGNTIVKQKMKERYGNKIPLEESVISPASIFDCPLLETVKSN
ncbi:MAG TPA: YiiX family permuted papain-like enzyme [Cytophagaceae bacterium]|jgi:uncharacterized protein YycO|nr:YiiX family permuted papain-like enzyme [Cytophagaceae bacterium]